MELLVYVDMVDIFNWELLEMLVSRNIQSVCMQGKDEKDPRHESAEERLRRRAYERGCQRLKKRIEGI